MQEQQTHAHGYEFRVVTNTGRTFRQTVDAYSISEAQAIVTDDPGVDYAELLTMIDRAPQQALAFMGGVA